MIEGLKVLIAENKPGNVKDFLPVLEAMGVPWVLSLQPEDAEGCSHLLLPGGGDANPRYFGEENRGSQNIDDELDAAQFSLLRIFEKKKKPILGVCRGCQLINIYFGGSIYQDLTTAGFHRRLVENWENYHTAQAEEGSLICRLYGENIIINSSHHQGCKNIAEGFRVSLRAPDGVVEAIEHRDLPILGVQWHPERMCFANRKSETADGERILRAFLDFFGK